MCHPAGHRPWSWADLTPEQRVAFEAAAEAYSRQEPFPTGHGGTRYLPLWQRARAIRTARIRTRLAAEAQERLLAQAEIIAAAAWGAGDGEAAGTGVSPTPAAPSAPEDGHAGHRLVAHRAPGLRREDPRGR
jgi:hypothetical protein